MSEPLKQKASSPTLRLRIWGWLRIAIICVVGVCVLGALLRQVQRQVGSLLLFLGIVGTVVPSVLAIAYSSMCVKELAQSWLTRPMGRAVIPCVVHIAFICGVVYWLVKLSQLIFGLGKA